MSNEASSPSILDIPFYHGTDRKTLALSAEERSHMHDACRVAIDGLLRVYKANGIQRFVFHGEEREILGENSFQVQDALIIAGGLRSNSPLYQYTYTYLTNGFDRAKSYAVRSFIFGELGYASYYLLQGAKLLGYDLKCLSVQEEQAIAIIEEKALEEKQPVVLKFVGIKPESLSLENGRDHPQLCVNLMKGVEWEHHNGGKTYGKEEPNPRGKRETREDP